MDNPAQIKWNEKYRNAALSTPAEPCWALRQHSRLLPLSGTALDLAAGLGGNARFLAQCGLAVEAWDISDTAVNLLNRWAKTYKLPIHAHQVDLSQSAWPDKQFDVVVISRWLDRAVFNRIKQLIKPEGRVFYQTFLAPVQENGPRNPDYYVRSGELVKAFLPWRIEVHGEGWLTDTDDEKHRYSWLVAQNTVK